jgi:predicted pyridoxine 5'-phosphate oxidase superfamily flavin-nucleotide-binding protein
MNHLLKEFLLSSDCKALATMGADGINVVPVSTIRIVDDKIWLFNYFMKRTADNLQQNSFVALSCWSDMNGFQIKGVTQYMTTGAEFESACQIIKKLHPERNLQGLIILEVTEIFSLSPGKDSSVNLMK